MCGVRLPTPLTSSPPSPLPRLDHLMATERDGREGNASALQLPLETTPLHPSATRLLGFLPPTRPQETRGGVQEGSA